MVKTSQRTPPESETVKGHSVIRSLGRIGLVLSMIGVASLFFLGWTGPAITELGSYLAFSSLAGMALSAASHIIRPTSATRWGVGVGLLGTFYLATIWFGLTHH